MKTKRLIITLLALIAATPTIGSTYLLSIDNRQFTPTSSPITTVSVSPTNVTAQLEIDQTFIINITLSNVNDLYVWQVGMTFNSTILEALSFAEGSFLKEIGTTLWAPGTINNTVGIIHYHASALAANVTGASGNGTLGTITFKVKGYGNSTLPLTEVIMLDSQLESTNKTLIHGAVRVKIPGDLNGDEIVNAIDLAALARTYGSSPSSPNWNAEADINGDLIVNELDLAMLDKHYSETT